jgi:hypothetical protein
VIRSTYIKSGKNALSGKSEEHADNDRARRFLEFNCSDESELYSESENLSFS